MGTSENPKPVSGELTFEESLNELQELVRALEEGNLGLEESIAVFERGITCLRRCYEVLHRAEQRIELLTGFDEAGNPVTGRFDAAATHDPSDEASLPRRRKSVPKKAEPAGGGSGASDREEQGRGPQLF